MSLIPSLPTKVITLILNNMILFPDNDLTIKVNKETGLYFEKLLKSNQEKNIKSLIAVTARRNSLSDPDKADVDEIFQMGVLATITSIIPKNRNEYQIRVHALPIKFRISELNVNSEMMFESTGEAILDNAMIVAESQESLTKMFLNAGLIRKLMLDLDEVEPDETYHDLIPLFHQITQMPDSSQYLQMTNALAYRINLPLEHKFMLLEAETLSIRMDRIVQYLSFKLTHIKEEKNAQSKTLADMQKNQREFVIKEQIKTLKKELGDSAEDAGDEFETKLNKTALPSEIKKIAKEELSRLKQLSPNSADYHVIKNYLEWIMAIPWFKATKDNLDISRAREVLDEDHYGLMTVKKRVLEFLSISNLRGNFKGNTLCLVGPPGVGKTSLVRSIATAVGRKYVRISLGGVHDESEIRGHRKTYVGSMPGKIIQNLKKVGVNNPIILLDEIDKLGKSAHGDPAAALLEVLDPEQNNAFNDHFINAPVDLSNVFFIATANSLEDIPGPLRDRMDIITLGSYTHTEKEHIVKNHLIKKLTKEFCLDDKDIKFTDDAIRKIINEYTRESGVRDLQRKIGQIFRYLAQEFVEKKISSVIVDLAKVAEILGRETAKHESAMEEDQIGVVSGLAWTSVGGEMLFIESSSSPGTGQLKLTGSLGDVMKESAIIAMSYIKANAELLGIKEFDFTKNDIHLHFPSGATPKDGPSAGIAICSCLVSLFSGKKLSNKLAMTGEISLRGNVLPVGGIKEKVIAAHRAGIKNVLLPKENESSADEIPAEVAKDLNISYVSTFNDVMTKIMEK